MRLDEYSKHDALGLAELVRKGETTPAELRQAALDGIAKVNPALNAVLQVLADASAKEVAAGVPDGPFQRRAVPDQGADVPRRRASRSTSAAGSPRASSSRTTPS